MSHGTDRQVRLRKLWLKLHCYIGLSVGAVPVLLGLTGSLLVFNHAIDEYLNPALLTTNGAGPYRTLDEIATAARVTRPDGSLTRIIMPRTKNGVFVARVEQRTLPDNELTRWELAIDPHTAEVLGQREWGAHLMSFLYKLHYSLWLGETGETLVGISGVLLLLSILTGLYLWWPLAWPLRNGKFRRAITFKRRASSTRRNFDLHKVCGIYGAPVLAVAAISGVYLALPEFIRPIVHHISELTAEPAPVSSKRPGTKPISLNDVAVIAKTIFPRAELNGIGLPKDQQGVYTVTLRQPGEVRIRWGASRVWIDQHTGDVLATRDPKTMSGGNIFLEWQFPLHNGEAFGAVGKVVVFLAGMIPLALYVTGINMWRRRQFQHREMISYRRFDRSA